MFFAASFRLRLFAGSHSICRLLSAFVLLAGVGLNAHAAGEKVIELWPEGVPDLNTNVPHETVVNGRIFHVNHPTLTRYAPEPEKANGTAVIFCPGGGYVRLTIGSNGGPETKWLNSLGITVFVLKYRMVDYGYPAPLRDVLRAVRIVRSRAAEFGVETNRIGVFGASSGGHVAGCAATMWDYPEGRTGAPLDAVSARPDFAMLLYPVVTMEDPYVHKGSRKALLGDHPSAELIERMSVEKHVRKNSPPALIIATMADHTVPVENSLHLYEAFRQADVPAEMHVYAQGSHGNSRDLKYGPTAHWPERAEEWLRFNGWLSRGD